MHFDPSGQRVSIPLSALMDRYRIARDLTTKAGYNYQIVCNLAQRFAGRELTTDELFTIEFLESWLAWLKTTPPPRRRLASQPRSKSTLRGKIKHFWTLWRFAWSRKLTTRKPQRSKLPTIKVPVEDPVAWSIEEYGRILEQAKTARPVMWWTGRHWFTLLAVYFITTERFRALMACRRDDIDNEHLRIRGSNTKDKKASSHRLPSWLLKEMLSLPRAGDWIEPGRANLIWQWPNSLDNMREHYKRDILTPAGLPADRYHLFHCIRRSGLTELVNEAGLEVAQRQARHFSPGLTMSRYVDPTKLRHETGADVLARRILQPPHNP